jgi:two-component system, NarL family, response regulator NreC
MPISNRHAIAIQWKDARLANTQMRLLIVDDHEIVLDSLAAVLGEEPGIKVVGIASSIREGSQLLLDLVPDVVLADLALDDGNASELLRLARRARLPSRILILTGLSDHLAVSEHLREGAAGIVLKAQSIPELLSAIRIVANGGRYLPPALSDIEQAADGDANGATSNMTRLSRRENEIFRMVVKGWALKDIASKLFISIKTVESHRTNINRKLGVRTIADLVRLASAQGIAIAPRTSSRETSS